jgi:hypothetical protein
MQSYETLPSIIDAHVSRGLARYLVYQNLMRGALAEIIPTATFDLRLHRELSTSLRRTVTSAIDNETTALVEAGREIATVAGVESQMSAMELEQSTGEAIEAAGARLLTDAQAIRQMFKKIALKAYVASQASTLFAEELFRRAYVEESRNFSFKQSDRRGRQFGAEIYWRYMLRSHFFGLVNSLSIMQLAEQGASAAKVHAPGHGYHGRAVGLRPNEGLPTYDDMRDEVFHPNSDALVIQL